MIHVNLLPYHLRPIKRSPLPYIGSGLVLILAVLVMGGIALHTQAQIHSARSNLGKVQRDLESKAEIVKESQALLDQKTKLAKKITVIEDIIRDRIIWSRQLWNISRLLPDNFWYSRIEQKEKQVKKTRQVLDEKTQKLVPKEIAVPQDFLELDGYVIKGDNGYDIAPLTFNTEQDKEFAALFQLNSPKLVDTEFEGYKVRSFTLEYLILTGGNEK